MGSVKETGYSIMNRNDFETGGWQPRKEQKRTMKPQDMLILAGIVLLAILVIFLSQYLNPSAQTDRTASQIADVEPLHDNLASAVVLAEDELVTQAPVELLNEKNVEENAIEDNANYLLLVNSKNPLVENYEPENLVAMDSIVDRKNMKLKEDQMLGVSVAVQALDEMLADATKQGYSNWQITDAYRSIPVQQEIWDKTYEKYLNENGLSPAKALQATQRRVAEPGCSEHHTGLAFDLSIPGESFRLTKQCTWIAQNCWRYGFIVRYSEEKERITGITAEPWHVRYVGEKDAAEIYKNNLCLEEYVK